MKVIPVTVYIVSEAPGLSRAQWHVRAEQDEDYTYSADELGIAVARAVTHKFVRMAANAISIKGLK